MSSKIKKKKKEKLRKVKKYKPNIQSPKKEVFVTYVRADPWSL